MLDEAARQRRAQNLDARRTEVRSVAPSIRSFAQAVDRQRASVERIPVLRGSRPGLAAIVRALDEAEAAAIALHLDDPQAELSAAAQAVRDLPLPVLRTDLLLEEFQIYESRAMGADAVLLHAALLAGPLLQRLCDAARSTHMAAAVACATVHDVERAIAARAPILALVADALGAVPEALLAAVPRRTAAIALALDPAAPIPPIDPRPLVGRVDAILDPALGAAGDPAAELRRHLDSEGAS